MSDIKKVLESVRVEDFIEYFLFPIAETQIEDQQLEILNKTLKEANKLIEHYTKDYLWHKDEFKLVARTTMSNILVNEDGGSSDLPPHLYGVSHVGDSIDDEWFMVFLIQKLTEEISGLVGKVQDVDGEFLLIEAANHLPEWASPETCENKVYIYEGNIHIIIPPAPENPTPNTLTISQSLSIVRSPISSGTHTSVEIQNAIASKLAAHPLHTLQNIHCTVVHLPQTVATLLQHRPALIAPAVHALCERDAVVDARVCRAMKFFPPEGVRVTSTVRMTRRLYAMLTHNKYVPDRRTGWNLPAHNSAEYKSHSLGVKIACGFEILVAQAKPSLDVSLDRGWVAFLKNLTDKNYFCGLLEHSRPYNQRLEKAKIYYVEHRDSMQFSPKIGQEILDLLHESLEYRENEVLREDDDGWLNLDENELDEMLKERYGESSTKINEATNPSDFGGKISNFLHTDSGLEGVEFPNEAVPTRPPRRKNKVTFDVKHTAADNSKNRVSFDADAFSPAVQNILDFVIPEDDGFDSESSMSDYGREEEAEEVDAEGGAWTEIEGMREYMEKMDLELQKTTLGKSFVKKKNSNDSEEEKSGLGEDELDDDFEPVDIDVNALKNILESYRSQLGEAGPSSNMLGPMGLHVDNLEKK